MNDHCSKCNKKIGMNLDCEVCRQWRYDTVSNFLGIGDPNGKVWFIGIEEAEEWKSELGEDGEFDKYQRYAAKEYLPNKPGQMADDAEEMSTGYTKIYDIMSKIMVYLKSGNNKFDFWGEYRNKELFLEGKDTFQANLLPFGKKSVKEYPKRYEDLFGKTEEDLHKTVLRERIVLIRHRHKEYQPKLTICFGKCEWDNFKEIFDLTAESPTIGDRNEKWEVYQSDCYGIIVLCRFFSYRFMSHKVISELFKTKEIKDAILGELQ